MRVAVPVTVPPEERSVRGVGRLSASVLPLSPAILSLVLAAFAGLSLLVFPSGLGADPSAWMIWGRELTHLSLNTTGGPAVKPLPVLLAALLSPAGHVEATIWLILIRASAVLAVVLAFRLASRRAGRLAGLVAAASLAFVLSDKLLWATLEGYAEAPAIALVLGAIDRHLARRPGQAFALLGLAGLCRPEAWPLLAVYAALHWRRERPLRALFVLVLIALPAAWIGLDWWGSGHLFMGPAPETLPGSSTHNAHPGLVVLTRTASLMPLPAIVGLAVSIARRRGARARLERALAVGALAWVAIVAFMSQAGFAGDPRYVVVPVAVLTVPAGIGLAGFFRQPRGRRARLTWAVVLWAMAATYGLAMVSDSARQLREARSYGRKLADLPAAVARAGGSGTVLWPGPPAINPDFHAALSGELNVSFTRVQNTWTNNSKVARWKAPAVVFRTKGTPATGAAPQISRRNLQLRELARTSEWSVYLATPRRAQAPAGQAPR